jgi:uncharacterized protein (DUF779 family)
VTVQANVTATPAAIDMVIAGAPFYVDREQYERWGHPSFLIDTRPGAAEGFSLSLPDAHFVTRAPPKSVE